MPLCTHRSKQGLFSGGNIWDGILEPFLKQMYVHSNIVYVYCYKVVHMSVLSSHVSSGTSFSRKGAPSVSNLLFVWHIKYQSFSKSLVGENPDTFVVLNLQLACGNRFSRRN